MADRLLQNDALTPMPILGIAHYNFRLSRALMDEICNFYVAVVGLTVGPRPAFRSAGYWLYAGEQDLLHLTEEASGDRRRTGTELTFDHVALHSTDWPSHRARLLAHSIPFTEDRVPGSDRLQVFFRDPAGNGVELIFAAGEA